MSDLATKDPPEDFDAKAFQAKIVEEVSAAIRDSCYTVEDLTLWQSLGKGWPLELGDRTRLWELNEYLETKVRDSLERYPEKHTQLLWESECDDGLESDVDGNPLSDSFVCYNSSSVYRLIMVDVHEVAHREYIAEQDALAERQEALQEWTSDLADSFLGFVPHTTDGGEIAALGLWVQLFQTMPGAWPQALPSITLRGRETNSFVVRFTLGQGVMKAEWCRGSTEASLNWSTGCEISGQSHFNDKGEWWHEITLEAQDSPTSWKVEAFAPLNQAT